MSNPLRGAWVRDSTAAPDRRTRLHALYALTTTNQSGEFIMHANRFIAKVDIRHKQRSSTCMPQHSGNVA